MNPPSDAADAARAGAAPARDGGAAEAAIRQFLGALGRDLADPNLTDTPRRVVQAFDELLSRAPLDLTTFPNDEGYGELVLVRDIPFVSLCAHHLLPFRGTVQVGYLPTDRLLGLSKLARVVAHFAHDLQLQERLTVQIADFLQDALDARGVGVVIEAEHLCMSIRGVQAGGAVTRTSRFTGALASTGPAQFAGPAHFAGPAQFAGTRAI
ncbi:GTP cyclohydrolase I [Agromyces sp. LY-1074]|nr:GTP cyclohydrolase I [Agromyces sp. LY-1074]